MRRLAASLWFLTLLLALPLVSGCYSVPQSPRTAGLDDRARIAEAAPEYWESRDLPSLPAKANIALVEFSVEFVTEKLESPGGRQPWIFGFDYGTAGFVLTAFGVGKKSLVLTKDSLESIPNDMHDVFVRELLSRGFSVVPDEKVSACASYRDFQTRGPGAANFFQRLDFTGSDTGNSKVMPLYPARGHVAVAGAGSRRIPDVENALLKELGADAVLRARFRVGLYQGHVAVERGSRIYVTTAAGSGELRAIRSLVSDVTAAERGQFKLFRGNVYSPDPASCRTAVLDVFPSYASLADQMLRPSDSPAALTLAADK